MPFVSAFAILPYRLALRRPWRSARGTVTHREGFLVRLDTAEGPVGFGDCAPLPGHGTETAAEALAALEEMRGGFRGGPVQGLMAGLVHRRPRNPAACCAVETACIDLLAQDKHKPLRRYLQPQAGNRVKVNGVVGGLDDGAPDRAAGLLAEGYRVLKVKLGIADWPEELERLRALPEGALLRLDANGAWTAEQTRTAIADLADLPIEALEEPCATADMVTLAALQDAAPFAIALDESLIRLGPEAVIAARPVKRLVLKPAVLGSLGLARFLGHRARAAGMEAVVTTALDSAVGVLAACQVAAAIDIDGTLAHGLSTSSWLAEDVGQAPAVENGTLRLPELPGLGFIPR
ncbi:MAG: o-succinylbenzoate synthase [Magnetospirillum sp. WYHS-4]